MGLRGLLRDAGVGGFFVSGAGFGGLEGGAGTDGSEGGDSWEGREGSVCGSPAKGGCRRRSNKGT